MATIAQKNLGIFIRIWVEKMNSDQINIILYGLTEVFPTKLHVYCFERFPVIFLNLELLKFKAGRFRSNSK
jgi:hypothetical protein